VSETVVRGPADVEALLPRAARRHVRRVRLEWPPLGDRERARTERRLARGLRACGCETGAAFVLLTLVALVARGVPGAGGVAAGLGVCLVSGVVGKLAGLAVAEVSVRRSLRRLARSA